MTPDDTRRMMLRVAPPALVLRAVGATLATARHTFASPVVELAGETWLPCIRCGPPNSAHMPAGPAVAKFVDGELQITCTSCRSRLTREALEDWLLADLTRWDAALDEIRGLVG